MKNKVQKTISKFLGKVFEMKEKVNLKMIQAKENLIEGKKYLLNSSGDGFIDTVLKMIIGLIIGGLILTGLILLINATVFPNLTKKIGDLFN